MLNKRIIVAAAAVIFVAVSCKTRDFNIQGPLSSSSTKMLGDAGLPQLTVAADHMPMVLNRLKFMGSSPVKNDVAVRISSYLAFLGMVPGSKLADDTAKRLFESSTQFLFCENLEDWDCLEKDPVVTPTAESRRAAVANLGKRIDVSEPLKAEFFYTERWQNKLVNKPERKVVPDGGPNLVDTVARKIREFGSKALSISMYGIDDIDGSMKPLFDAILDQRSKGAKIRAVMDVEGFNKDSAVPRPFIFSFVEPSTNQDAWLLKAEAIGPKKLQKKTTPMIFQYAESQRVAHTLNEGVTRHEDAVARIEFPIGPIMHNKYIVMEGSSGLSLWTGTANFAQTCMGVDANSNVGLFVQNSIVAKAYLDEFNHMYEFSPTPAKSDSSFTGADGKPTFAVGRFHNRKIPVSNRYFKFSDGNEVRVHFSPTDDSEHRLHIPLIHSARKGDVIRIAMFAASGDEYVRAFQMAAARGVDVRIVIGAANGSGAGSWVKDTFANTTQPNPYNPAAEGKISVLFSGWQGLHHHKSATLTRANGRVETIIVGSQNWSLPGNDENDENSIAIRNLATNVPGGLEFNKHFDDKLMPNSNVTVRSSSSN